jgi:hypothetical protein
VPGARCIGSGAGHSPRPGDLRHSLVLPRGVNPIDVFDVDHRGEHHDQRIRIPRRLRGSTTWANAARRPGASATGSGRSTPLTWSATAGIDKDAGAGTTLHLIKAGLKNRHDHRRSRARTVSRAACRRSSAPTRRDFDDPLTGRLRSDRHPGRRQRAVQLRTPRRRGDNRDRSGRAGPGTCASSTAPRTTGHQKYSPRSAAATLSGTANSSGMSPHSSAMRASSKASLGESASILSNVRR